MITKKCLGCGIELQCEDKNKEGFVPEEKLLTQENLLCQRCYKIKNYGQNLANNFVIKKLTLLYTFLYAVYKFLLKKTTAL